MVFLFTNKQGNTWLHYDYCLIKEQPGGRLWRLEGVTFQSHRRLQQNQSGDFGHEKFTKREIL